MNAFAYTRSVIVRSLPLTHPAYATLLSALMALACNSGMGDESSESSAFTSPATSTTSGETSTGDPTSTGTSGEESTGPSCAKPLGFCGDLCVDLENDPNHCGDCDQICAQGLTCLEGQCGVACGPMAVACGETCTDLDLDPNNCGECEHTCDPGIACLNGVCTPDCAEGELLCGELCSNPNNDESNCGACDNSCPDDQLCVYGDCIDTSINYFLIGGQSLSVGSGAMAISLEQPYDNLMLNTGVRAGIVGLTNFVPLVEAQQGGLGETIASGLANLVTELEVSAGRVHVLAASSHGIGGQPYAALKKGTPSFSAGLTQVEAATSIAADAGESFAVRAVTIIHGESDHLANNPDYDQNLLEWQSDYETDVIAITGQSLPVPLFLCQMSSHTKYNSTTSRIPFAQLAAADARPDRIYVVGPKYFLPYVDGVHLSGDGERWLGEHYAKAYRRVLIDGEPWVPLRPRALSREGAVITIEFNVPSPPLVLDEEMILNPGNYGFEYFDTSGAPPAIIDVKLAGSTRVQITLEAEPIAGNKHVRYAYTGIAGQPGGPMTGARGNLRDSDATPSRHDYPLYNWAVHFDETVD